MQVKVSGSKPSYHDDPNTFHLSKKQKQEERNLFSEIAKELPRNKWKDLARVLELSEATIEELEMDNTQLGLREVKLQMLLTWKQEQPMEKTTFDMLIHALIRVDLLSLAEQATEFSVSRATTTCSRVQSSPQ